MRLRSSRPAMLALVAFRVGRRLRRRRRGGAGRDPGTRSLSARAVASPAPVRHRASSTAPAFSSLSHERKPSGWRQRQEAQARVARRCLRAGARRRQCGLVRRNRARCSPSSAAIGTPTARRIAPALRRAKIPFVGHYTGADFLSDARRYPNVVNVRTVYGTRRFGGWWSTCSRSWGARRFGIIFQDDSFGRSVLASYESALEAFDSVDPGEVVLLPAHPRRSRGACSSWRRRTWTS